VLLCERFANQKYSQENVLKLIEHYLQDLKKEIKCIEKSLREGDLCNFELVESLTTKNCQKNYYETLLIKLKA